MSYLDLYEEEASQRERLNLAGLVVLLAITGVVFYKLAGLPHLPTSWPRWDLILLTLRSPDIPLEALVSILTPIAWLVWLWAVFSVVVEVTLALVERVTRGAEWVRRSRAVVSPLTIPWVRHVVDGAIVAAFVVNAVSRTAVPAAAAPEKPIVLMTGQPHDEAPRPGHAPTLEPEPKQQAIRYTVQPGDTLWSIAERFYADGDEFARLVDANDGRTVAMGQRFTREGVIQPGWTLLVPLPATALDVVETQTYYVVEPGDTLWSISARLLGDPLQWPRIFELNRGVARHPRYGWTMTNPNLIWPGLRLQVPTTVHTVPQPREQRRVIEVETAPIPPPVETPTSATAVSPSLVPTSAPTAEPTAVPMQPTVAPTPVATEVPAETPGETASPLVWGAVALSAAAAGAAALAARRRFRRSLAEPPIRDPAYAGPQRGFVEADLVRSLVHRLQGDEVEVATLVADQVLRCLKDEGVEGVGVLSVRQGTADANLVLSGGLEQQARVLELVDILGTRLGCTASASLTADRDIELKLKGLTLNTVLAPSPVTPGQTCLLPVGMAPKHDTLYANWRSLDHILIAGSPGSGAETVLTSLLAALAARGDPRTLRLWTVASDRVLPAQLGRLPHQEAGLIDPSDEAILGQKLARLQEMCNERLATERADQAPARLPSLYALVAAELTELRDQIALLDWIAAHGTSQGIRVIAATTRPEAVDDATLTMFGTRIVLQTLDEEQSIRLLGRPDAADLNHGEMLICLDHRPPVWARGFLVAPNHVDEIVRLMAEHYGQPASVTGARTPIDVEPGPDAEEGDKEESPSSLDRLGLTAFDTHEAPPPSVNGHSSETVEAMGEPTVEAVVPTLESVPDRARDMPLVRLQCFGDFVVFNGSEKIEPEGKEGKSFKAWEVLAFLATYPDERVPREKLLAALWPDLDPSDSSSRLRHAVQRLRAVLQEQFPALSRTAITTERDDTRRIDHDIVWSDAREFLRLCTAARKLSGEEGIRALEQALELYQDDLLVRGGADTYTWPKERGDSGLSLREYYRAEYDDATRRLAQLYYDNGQAALAVPLLKRLLNQEPTVEDVVRALYRCYGQLGDLNSLIREDRHLRDALHEAYHDPSNGHTDPHHYQPELETVALFNALQDKLKVQRVH